MAMHNYLVVETLVIENIFLIVGVKKNSIIRIPLAFTHFGFKATTVVVKCCQMTQSNIINMLEKLATYFQKSKPKMLGWNSPGGLHSFWLLSTNSLQPSWAEICNRSLEN